MTAGLWKSEAMRFGSETVGLEIAGGIARLTLERPDAANAIDLDVAQGLCGAASELAARDDVRVVVLSSGGKLFCAGGDLGWMQAQDDPAAGLHVLATALHKAIEGFAALDAPVVARVHGAAAGAGMSLVLGADLAVASTKASFTMAYTSVGLSPDGGSSYLLPRLVGQRRATEIILTNRRVGAEEAERIGMITRAVEPEALDDAVEALAASLAAGPTSSYGAAKRLFATTWTASMHDQLADEADAIAACAGSPAGQEGISAFLAKRKPDFAGAS